MLKVKHKIVTNHTHLRHDIWYKRKLHTQTLFFETSVVDIATPKYVLHPANIFMNACISILALVVDILRGNKFYNIASRNFNSVMANINGYISVGNGKNKCSDIRNEAISFVQTT